ncbi:MAG: SDR family NAD(P)-dependent oxidoreductase [Kiloniellales bacterium]
MSVSAGKPLEDKLVLVTGASRGLGRALALEAAAAGARLILVARTVGGLEEVDDEARKLGAPESTLVPLDLNESEVIDPLGAALYQRFGRLDGLVVAHGTLGQLSPVGHVVPKVWNETLAVNCTAVFRLIRTLHPLLNQAEAPRALFVTDETGKDRAYWAPYMASKAAMEAVVVAFATENQKTALRANLAVPPPMATALRAGAYPGEDPTSLPAPETVAPLLLPLIFAEETRNGARVKVVREDLHPLD